jgi:ABC-2 type transport system permease protein
MAILRIAWKDLKITFRDRTALLLMLAAPLALTFGLALIAGKMSGDTQPAFQHIPVAIVNLDGGKIGAQLVDAMGSPDLKELVSPLPAVSVSAARTLVDADKAAAAVIIPAGFTDSITGVSTQNQPIEVYANPSQEISASIITAVAESFAQQVALGRVSGAVAVEQMLADGRISPAQAANAGLRAGERAVQKQEASSFLRLASTAQDTSPDKPFDAMAFFAPSMAIVFLMFTVSSGARSLLAEKENGALARLASAPIRKASILGGKMLGMYLTAIAQMAILLAANSLLFGVKLGDPFAVAVLVAALAAAASGWGMLLAAVARTANQVNSLGSALMLTFGILGGAFLPIANMPDWFQWISKITPTAWGMEGFLALSLGDPLSTMTNWIAALGGMAAVLFAISVWTLSRKGLLRG